MLQPFSVFILKLIRKKTLKELTWRVKLRTLFPFLCSISGARSMVNPNDLNFNDVICFVACTKKKVNLGFLSQNVPKLCLRHLKVFTNRFYGL